ncbi:protein kinase domain-containing protein [Pyxidicoccus xibeiensis]|uniref:protein kinase domain-containing protein n=1 Tax=Pyxidicoccus xibeiensis TaxID=2906759 RepID=UPI0020A6E720|nr:protein kinase [Pyxidicoccus xibeiensis]MCP3140886.1 protein kinase [Pyxidicoccus xibeiensis]
MPRCPKCQSEYEDGLVYCPRDAEALLPMVLEGRYRLLSPLGAGGMGRVYLAEHVGLGKRVAVKVLRGEFSRDATFARRFELEAIAASQMGHENIVDVTDLGRTPGGELYYVMELLEGASLGSVLLRERYLPLSRAVPVLAQVCRALEAAHARGIVHRDVKPQNVMLLMREGRPDFVKVVDFGISKVSTPQGVKLTEAGAILGTADYMAPEQARGIDVDASADVYAVGVLTYELCTGTLPFRGENTFATILQHVEATPEPPGRRRPELGLPPELDALVMAALAKNPAARPSMARFRAGLEALPVGARTIPLVTSAGVAPPEAPASPRHTPTAATRPLTPSRRADSATPVEEEALPPTVASGGGAPERTRRSGGWRMGAGAVVLAAAAGLVWMNGAEPPPTTRATPPAQGDASAVAASGPGASSAPGPGAPPASGPASARPDTASAEGGPASAPATRHPSARATEPAPSSETAARTRLHVRSTPPGASVSVGGRVLGVTPLVLDRAAVGEGPLRFTLQGHESVSVERLTPGTRLDVTLKKQASSSVRTPAPTRLPKVQDLKPNPF